MGALSSPPILVAGDTCVCGVVVGTVLSMTDGVCPRCGSPFLRPPATSRLDDITKVCEDCGTKEALWIARDEGRTPLPPINEPVVL